MVKDPEGEPDLAGFKNKGMCHEHADETFKRSTGHFTINEFLRYVIKDPNIWLMLDKQQGFSDEIEPKKVEECQQKKGELQEEISHLEREVDKLKQERKATKKHITISELPEDERFSRLSTKSKYLIDTIKMIAYRAETAMSNLLRERMSHPDEARSLLRAIYNAEGDILPDQEAGTLTIRLHQLTNHMSSESIRYLCEELNSTETIFPGTNLRLVYELVS